MREVKFDCVRIVHCDEESVRGKNREHRGMYLLLLGFLTGTVEASLSNTCFDGIHRFDVWK
jgi:hypothetical protein